MSNRYRPYDLRNRGNRGFRARGRGQRGSYFQPKLPSEPQPSQTKSSESDALLQQLEEEEQTTRIWLRRLRTRRLAVQLNLFSTLGLDRCTFPEHSGAELREALDLLEQKHLSLLFYNLDKILQEWQGWIHQKRIARRQELKAEQGNQTTTPGTKDAKDQMMEVLQQMFQTIQSGPAAQKLAP